MRISIARGGLVAAALAVGVQALPGCADHVPGTAGGGAGSFEIALVIGGGFTLDAVNYAITGPASFAKTGTIDVSQSATLTATIGGIPAGRGFTIALSGDTVGGTASCAGAAAFDITAAQTTRVTVDLKCHEAPRTGSVLVIGRLNVCPVIDGITALPDEVNVGASVSLTAAAHDSDAGPAPLHYQWSAPSGTFDDPSTTSPLFTCTSAGPVTVTLTVFDGDPAVGCAATMDLAINCSVEPAVAKRWRTSMADTPLPRTGCFKAVYPSTVWQPVPCSSAPQPTPLVPFKDFRAQTTGLISQAVGSFDSVTGVTNLDSDSPGLGPFSLQLNANFFTTKSCGPGCTACAGGCAAWQQFFFQNGDVEGTRVSIEYWLLDFPPPCPDGWTLATGGCTRFSDSADVPGPLNSNLAAMSLVGKTTGTMDTVILSTTGGDLEAVGANHMVDLQPAWSFAEFNVLGEGGGTTANFNTGSTLVVRTAITDGTGNAPTCIDDDSPSGEKNNLNMISPCCTVAGAEPAIVFTESNADGAMSTCPPGSCTAGQKVLADTILSSGANCGGSSADFDFGQASCDSGFTLGSCSATFVAAGSDNGSTCSATPTGGCICHVHATTPSDCLKAVHCHVLVTEQPSAGPLPQILTNKTGHNGSDCGGTSADYDFPATCDSGFTLGDCSAHLLTDANGSTCTATPIGDCGCRLHITTPSDCFKFASCSLIATEVPSDWTAGCSSLQRF